VGENVPYKFNDIFNHNFLDMVTMERSQTQQGVWPTANEVDYDAVGDSRKSHVLTKEKRHLLVQYFTSRTSSSGQTRLTGQGRQQIGNFHGDFENSHYHNEGVIRHHLVETPLVNNRVTNSNNHEDYHVVRYVFHN